MASTLQAKRSFSAKVAVACRCQLLTGSYHGASRSCPCDSMWDCQLTSGDREIFKDHPEVKEAQRRNFKEFHNLAGQ